METHIPSNSDGTINHISRVRPTHPRRWLILFVVWGSFLLSYIDRVAWSSVAAPVGQSLGIAVGMLGAFVTAFYIGYVIANIVGGLVTDSLGGRKTLTFALIPLGIATFFFGNTQSLSTGVWIQLAMGLFAGADYSAGVKILTAWFGKDRGRAMGIYTTGTSLGVVIANAIVPSISASYGWEAAFRLLGIITFCWAIVTFVTIRETPSLAVQDRIRKSDFLAVLKNRNLIWLAIAGCGALWGTVGFGAWGNALMTKQYGISPVTAGSIIACFGVGAVIAKPTLGWLSDFRKGKRKEFAIGCLVCFAFLLFVFGHASTVTQFYVVAPLLGAAAFGYTPLLVAQVTEVVEEKFVGAAAGLTNAVWQMGSAAAPLFVGRVYGQTRSFELALVVLACGPLIGAVTLAFVASRKS
ncbi:MAG: MFS transporter [Nevskiaceae bacterium]|nr:MAG: MFS transporter [Nevskiaceae bacterium]